MSTWPADYQPTQEQVLGEHYGHRIEYCNAVEHHFQAVVQTSYNWNGKPNGQSVDLFCVKCGQYRRNVDACQ